VGQRNVVVRGCVKYMCIYGLTRDGVILGFGQNTSPSPLLYDVNSSLLYIFTGNKINALKLYMQFYTNKHSIFIRSELELILE
jgi:hypothetical protein